MKVRVYELAKEAGMDSKTLTAKLIELGYDVKTHSSSLDEAVAEEIREKLLKTHVEVQEKRIQAKGRTTVIRRRKKTVPDIDIDQVSAPAPEQQEAEAAGDKAETTQAPETTDSTEPPEKSAPETGTVAAQAGEAPAETATTASESEPAAESAPEKPAPETPPEAAAEPPEEREEAPETAAPAAETAPAPEEETAAGDEAEAAAAAKKKEAQDRARQGLAKVIKRAAIKLPVEEPRPPVRKKPRKPAAAGKGPGPGLPPADMDVMGGDRPAKGKKGKRFVKFHHEGAGRGKKGGRKKGYSVVDMEDVAMAGGRFSSALKLGRGVRGGKKNKGGAGSEQVGETKAIKKRIKVYETISISELAHRMGVKANEVIVKLMGLGVMATVNQSLDIDTATLVATDFGYEVEQGMTEEITILNIDDQESGGEEQPRPPVVTVMGHVDHGKTSILDAIRDTDVAAGEAGGITQHIGAHYVRSKLGDVVFLDTPGHAAFTEMRSRGAQITDVVVLVVAADDGVMDQTKEAINHAKAAGVPIVVAVNKIDKDDADPMRVKRELAEFDLVPEDWGGETIFCEVSAKKKIGIEELLEQILLQAEILELKADPGRKAKGRVVEARLHKGRGPVATILVQQGTLRVGDAFVVGEHYGKVRSLSDDKGRKIKEAPPSTPVEVQGLSGVPMSGDEFIVVPDEKTAKQVSSQRQMKSREAQLGKTTKISLDNLFEKLQEGDVKELNVLLRADVQGTLEAFGQALENLGNDEVRVRIIHEGTGTITESDVLLASASHAIIIGFNVRPSAKVQDLAKAENVDLRFYDVIYHALDDIRDAMAGMLEPNYEERVTGSAEVRQTFHVRKVGTIAGCYVTDGKIERNAKVRLLRDGVVIYTGNIMSLRRFKDDVKEVASGYECGIGIENFNDIKVGDLIEAFVLDEVAATL